MASLWISYNDSYKVQSQIKKKSVKCFDATILPQSGYKILLRSCSLTIFFTCKPTVEKQP